MRYELSVAPTVEPISVDDVEQHCQLGTIHDDQVRLVQGMITAARQWVENRLHRQLCTATWKLYLDEFPAVIEITDKLPVTAISSITYVDTAGDSQTWSSANYQTDYASENRPARIMPGYGKSYPSTRGDTFNAITITFTAGYGAAADVPQAIKNAILVLVAERYEHREQSVLGGNLNQVPFGIEACLAPYDWGAYS